MMLDYFYGQSGELFAYFRIPKALFQDSRFRQLSTDARTLYGILLDRMSLSAKNSWVDEHGRVYIIYTVREVQESLCCAEHKAVKLFRELEQADLIERKRRGLGRPSLIYVKNFSSGLPKAQIQNCANSNSCAAESAVQVRPKSQSNKTDKNKTEKNHPFLPDETDRLTQREQLEDYFYQALEVELLLRLCPDDEDAIYQIVDLLVDTCSTKRKMLRIAGDDKPVEVVRSRLKKLNADHIRFVLGCLAENTSPVRNMKQYLLAALFNAPTTMNLYYQNKTKRKAIYKDNADTIIGNMDSQIFLGGSEPGTLKDLSEMLGKETIDAFNTSDTRGNSPSYGTNYSKLGHELLSRDELAVMDGGKCILQLRGVRPFLSDKYDLTQHPNYKLTSDFDEKNRFDIEKYLNRKAKIHPDDEFIVVDADSLPSA